MESYMSLDDSGYKAEVRQLNQGSLTHAFQQSRSAKRTRAQFEDQTITSVESDIPYALEARGLRARLHNVGTGRRPGSTRPTVHDLPTPSPEASQRESRTRQERRGSRGIRRIGGFISTLASQSAKLLGFAWDILYSRGSGSLRSKEEEIIAVETDESGRKRRAITSPIDMITPPDSRAGSQQESSDRDPEDVTWEFDPNMTIPTIPTLSDLGSPSVQKVASRADSSTSSYAQAENERESVPDKTHESDLSLSNRQPPSGWPRDESSVSQKEVTDEAIGLEIKPRGKAAKKNESKLPNPKASAEQADDQRRAAAPSGPYLHSFRHPICHDRVDGPLRSTFSRQRTSLGRPLPLPPTARGKLHGGDHNRARKSEADLIVDSLVVRAEKLRVGTEQEQQTRELVRSTYRQRRQQEEARKARIAEEAEKAKAAEIAAQEEAERIALQKAKEEEERIAAEERERERQLEANSVIKSLNPKWQTSLEHAMRAKGNKKLAQGPEGNDLTRHDFGTLLAAPGVAIADAWLNDEIVNAWFGFLVQEKLEQAKHVKGNAAPYAAYNSAWFLKMRDEGAQSLKRWSRRKGIQNEKLLQAEKVFMPINTGSHWILLVVSPKARTMEVLNSMRGSPNKYFEYARSWLEMELGNKYDESEWIESESVSLLQDNSNDCGVFTCLNGLASATEKGYKGVTACRMQDARRMMGAVLLNGGFTGDFAL